MPTPIEDLQLELDATTIALRKCMEHATAGRLALEVMHDIRNPLEALRNLHYLISLAADKPDEVRRFGRLAEEQMDTVTDIANSVLSFAQTSSRQKRVPLHLLAEAALRVHQTLIETKKVRLVKDLPVDAVAPVYSIEMLQVISNLINNALDALPSEGTICIRLKKRKDAVHFLIADNGHGIPSALVDHVFEPFFTTKADHGTGLGLALTKRIIEERHSGTIAMRSSVRPGKSGTLFKVCLPA